MCVSFLKVYCLLIFLLLWSFLPNTCCDPFKKHVPTKVGCYILVATRFLPNIWAFAFVLASFCFYVVLPKFKLLEKGTWANTSVAIYLCSLSPASLTFAKDQTLLKIVLSRLSTYLWIFMAIVVAHCVVLASFSCLLISLSLSTTSFCIAFWLRMPKYCYDVTTWDLE